MRNQGARSPENGLQDRKFTRRNNNRIHIRSPKSPSSIASQNGFFVSNIAKPILKISQVQQQLYKAVKETSQLIIHNPFKRSKSERLFKKNIRCLTDPNVLNNATITPSEETNFDINRMLTNLNLPDVTKVVHELQAENVVLKSKLETLTKQLQNVLRSKEASRVCYLSKNCKGGVQDFGQKLAILQNKNKQLTAEIQFLQTQNLQFRQRQSIGAHYSPKSSKCTREESPESDLYIKELQEKYLSTRQQNQKLKIEIDYLRRKIHTDHQHFKKANNEELLKVKEKYIKLLQDYKELTKKHCDLTLKTKKFQKEMLTETSSTQKLEISLSFSESSQFYGLQ